MIAVDRLRSRVGAFELDEVSFSVPPGRYGVVIGPAGSGKTTLLETIAGIIPATGGQVTLAARDVTRLAPDARDVGIVYQHGYLFPHLSVEQNIRYGADDHRLADSIAARLGADQLAGRPVAALSGGERQVVALARALARRPAVLLLDEPFSALDPRRRVAARREVRAIHREWGTTVLQVTHDFTEAGMLGDVAILLDRGRVLQSGPPGEVFRRPATPYVAEFLGAENVFAGTVTVVGDDREAEEDARGLRALEFRSGALVLHAVGDAPEGPGHAVIRADEITLSPEPLASSARNRFVGTVREVVELGPIARVELAIGDGIPLVANLTTRSARELGLSEGMAVHASFKAVAIHLC